VTQAAAQHNSTLLFRGLYQRVAGRLDVGHSYVGRAATRRAKFRIRA